jgi:hypothetical protein
MCLETRRPSPTHARFDAVWLAVDVHRKLSTCLQAEHRQQEWKTYSFLLGMPVVVMHDMRKARTSRCTNVDAGKQEDMSS